MSFNHALPFVARWLKRPVRVIIMLGLVAAGLATISRHLAIAMAALGCLYWCVRIERRHFDQLAMPPLVLFGFQHVLSNGLGLPLIWLGMSMHGIMREGEMQAIWQTQVAHAIAFPLLVVGYLLGRAGSPKFSLGENATERAGTFRILSMVGWFLLAYFIISTAGGVGTGASDRSRILEFLDRGFGVWSWFKLFPRLNSLFFLLAPLMFSRAGNLGRLVLGATIGGAFGFYLLSGSRSGLLLPVCFLFIGWWMFYPHSRRVFRYAGLVAALAVPYIVLVPFYRSTAAFGDSQQTDWRARLAAVDAILPFVRETELGGTLQLTGEGLHGLSDREIFLQTPETLPHVGWQNLDRLKTFWLPSIVSPDKASLLDGNEIVQGYRPNDFVFGAGISFTADMFRRFDWSGVAIGSLVLGIFLGFIYRLAFRAQRGRRRVFATIFVLYGITYLCSTPYLTLLETCWIWLWEMPKHLLVLFFLTAFASVLYRRSRSERIAGDELTPVPSQPVLAGRCATL